MVWYKALIFLVNSGCEKVQFECGLDVIKRFFLIIHHSWQAPAAPHNPAQNTSKQLAQCNFHHACSCTGSVLFSNMPEEILTVDYVNVGQSFPKVGWYGKTCLYCIHIIFTFILYLYPIYLYIYNHIYIYIDMLLWIVSVLFLVYVWFVFCHTYFVLFALYLITYIYTISISYLSYVFLHLYIVFVLYARIHVFLNTL